MPRSSQRGVQKPIREVGLRDLVFMSIGGQSPFLSILVYGLVAYSKGGAFAPIAVVLGTLLVLMNGLVVYKLSMKFTQSGGYYTYTYYSLTKRLGFETGWTYLYYSALYGSAYTLGAIASIATVLPFLNVYELSIIFLIIASVFALLGKRPSFKYAMFASSLEILMMCLLALAFLYSTHFTFYNPFHEVPPLSAIATAIIFGSGIPTGYGSITPLSGEVKDPKKTVPIAIITVILLGGLLAAFDIYAIVDHIIYYNLQLNSSISFLQLIEDKFGLITLVLAAIAAVNDGILATLTFMFATSRTIYAMAVNGLFHSKLAELKNSREPFNAMVVTVIAYWFIIFTSLSLSGGDAFNAFTLVGLMAMLGNLYVHLATDFSLFRISLKRLKKRKFEIAISLASAIFTLYILITSVPSVTTIALDAFILWLLSGFMVAEIIDIVKQKEEEEK
ncbi:MAG: APC family permease [Sulfolobaceae archaeon]